MTALYKGIYIAFKICRVRYIANLPTKKMSENKMEMNSGKEEKNKYILILIMDSCRWFHGTSLCCFSFPFCARFLALCKAFEMLIIVFVMHIAIVTHGRFLFHSIEFKVCFVCLQYFLKRKHHTHIQRRTIATTAKKCALKKKIK